jgi:NOL1/NOP2/fmu family ribosome biogenesis protein
VIRSRANILKDNIIKWGCENVIVTNNDPKDISRLENYFDMIVVDAPCSGSGLFRRDPEAINEWSENNVALCSQRQQRILADVMPALKKEGILIYSTCSYSKSEDEDIIDWISTELRIQTLKLKIENGWSITEIETGLGTIGYRFWPDKTKGEGFFIACFKKREGEEEVEVKVKNKAEMITKKEGEVIGKWVKVKGHQLIKKENTVYAWPGRLMNDMNLLLSGLKVVYAGVRVGDLMRDKLIPDHALAMSGLVADSTARIDLNYEQAIRYLQRKDLKIDTAQKGWQLVNFEGHPTGWINVLPNRINNYYPKALRILKDVKSPPL